MKVAIIGAGLAGCALAYVFKKSGVKARVYEAADKVAGGASGNDVGLYNPRFFAERNPESDFYAAAFALAIRSFYRFDDVGWNDCGALHLVINGQKEGRFPKTVRSWQWEPEHMRMVGAQEASEIAGVQIKQDALYLDDSGYISPRKLCEFYMRDVDIEYEADIAKLDDVEADIVILANGYGAKSFVPWLPLSRVRGQLSYYTQGANSSELKTVLCYGGYCTPPIGGVHAVGSTFQRGEADLELRSDDDADNLSKLEAVVPNLTSGFEFVKARAGVRTTVKGHFPIIGKVPAVENLYVSTGHGSHGILSSLMGAYLLVDMILERPLSLSIDTVQALCPSRFEA